MLRLIDSVLPHPSSSVGCVGTGGEESEAERGAADFALLFSTLVGRGRDNVGRGRRRVDGGRR